MRIADPPENPSPEFRPGDKVRVTEGPFEKYVGVVDEVTEVTEEFVRLRTTINIFGRDTPVLLDSGQVEKV